MGAVRFWTDHLRVLEETGKATPDVLGFLSFTKDPRNIGYDTWEGNIRPGELGQWDVQQLLLMGGFGSPDECMLLAGFSTLQVADEQGREELRRAGVDPDDPEDVEFYQMTKNMSPAQLDRVIKTLESKVR